MNANGDNSEDLQIRSEGIRSPQVALKARIEAWIASQSAERGCDNHPDQQRQLNAEGTRQLCLSRPDGPDGFSHWEPQYFACPVCREERIGEHLRRAGVPEVLLHCSLDNWIPCNDGEKQHLQSCREFADKARKGVLILLGPVGIGKSHLAVGVQRCFRCAGNVFVKQSTLLRQLRATYSDKKASDPIERCQAATLLVLDEMGLSGGGKDEWPMLSEILDYRYADKKPTVITSNLSWEELQDEFGDRLADRMREAAYKVLVFSGPSHRPERRETYFA